MSSTDTRDNRPHPYIMKNGIPTPAKRSSRDGDYHYCDSDGICCASPSALEAKRKENERQASYERQAHARIGSWGLN